jgi:TPP-dependent pyruvate/acetoin dehydrogenase alpha subunit
MADQSATEATFENPLIPNAKLRQMYTAMARLRVIGEQLSSRSRSGGDLRDCEAALVATLIDLGVQDTVIDAETRSDAEARVLDFLRGEPAEHVLHPDQSQRRSRRRTLAECGLAARLPGGLRVQERMWAAVGAAGAAKARSKALKASAGGLQQPGVVIVYARAGELATRLWRKALAYASIESLPILFVVLPMEHSKPDSRTGAMSSIASQHGIPGMPVDCEDPIAVYRVAQEAIARARDGGGSALLECVHFAVEGTRSARKRTDALAALEQYILAKRVAKQSWMVGEVNAFRKRIGLKDLHPRK